MKIKIEADTSTLIKFWLVPLGISILGLAVYSARKALLIALGALFLAVALHKPVSWLSGHLPKRSRVGGTAAAFTLVVASLGVLVALLVPPIVQQTAKVAQTIPAVVDSATNQYAGLNELIQRYDAQEEVDKALESVKKSATSWATGVPSKIVSSLSSVGKTLAAVVIMLVMTFLMLINGQQVTEQFWTLYSDEELKRRHQRILQRIYNVVSGFIVGQLTIAGIGAAAMSLFVFILSMLFPVPANLVFPTAAIYGISTLIPFFGSVIAAIVLTLLIALNSLPAAIIFLVGYLIWQQIEANVISTAVQAKQLALSAFWVFIAATIGLYALGILGAIVSIPIAGVIKVLIEERAREQQLNKPKRWGKLARFAAKAKQRTEASEA